MMKVIQLKIDCKVSIVTINRDVQRSIITIKIVYKLKKEMSSRLILILRF